MKATEAESSPVRILKNDVVRCSVPISKRRSTFAQLVTCVIIAVRLGAIRRRMRYPVTACRHQVLPSSSRPAFRFSNAAQLLEKEVALLRHITLAANTLGPGVVRRPARAPRSPPTITQWIPVRSTSPKSASQRLAETKPHGRRSVSQIADPRQAVFSIFGHFVPHPRYALLQRRRTTS